jgi:hypothetical protein
VDKAPLPVHFLLLVLQLKAVQVPLRRMLLMWLV